MALNIKNVEVERLAGEVARLANETKTEAIRRALLERRARMRARAGKPVGRRSLRDYLEQSVWPVIPRRQLGRVLSREEEDQILGYGPHGYWTMVLDTSAIVAIHLQEPGYDRLIDTIDHAEIVVVGVPTLLETAMVLTSRLGQAEAPIKGAGQDARPMLLAFLRRLQCEVVAFNEEHLDAATTAFIRFGRGRHPAALNFGDCMAYAVASVAGMPLLFTGEDFGRTDIGRA
jgi:ribonuclease VapC